MLTPRQRFFAARPFSVPLRWTGSRADALNLCRGCSSNRNGSCPAIWEVVARLSPAGATVELGLARAKPELAKTAGEHRTPRGVTAGRVGKALKAEILRADVARNKATRPRRAQTAERVRNSESGWCRLGKPTQRSPGFIRRKDPNLMGGVVVFPLRVLHPRSISVALGWEASSGRTAREPAHFGALTRSTKPGGTLADVHSFGRVLPTG
jgi:hypothetical protein